MTMLLPLFILVGFIAGYFVNVMAYHLSPLEDKTALTFRQVLVHFWQKKYAWHDTVPLILCVAAAIICVESLREGGISVFQENLRLKRKERGLSQEELASRLHVVRQTISKWEKGQSVPDAEQLIKLAVILETTVSELLGTQVENEEESTQLAKELSRINTQLAIRNHRTRRVLKIIAIALLVFAALIFAIMALNYAPTL